MYTGYLQNSLSKDAIPVLSTLNFKGAGLNGLPILIQGLVSD